MHHTDKLIKASEFNEFSSEMYGNKSNEMIDGFRQDYLTSQQPSGKGKLVSVVPRDSFPIK